LLQIVLVLCLCALFADALFAQTATLTGRVVDETGGALPGVEVRVQGSGGAARSGALVSVTTDDAGAFSVSGIPAGAAAVTFSLPNFATARRDVVLQPGADERWQIVLHYVLSADVTVTGARTFTNLADVADPAENLVGVAQSASQGAVSAQQLQVRPMLRPAEVLETVTGVIATQHSGDGKANQYYLRGFNLDHGTDFSTTVAGMPVNLPTHAHGHGYTDLNFLIPELVNGVQYSKGPYFAEQGDFTTAGAANINYTNELNRPTARVTGGMYGYGRAFAGASVAAGAGTLLGAAEVEHNDGPWSRAGNFNKVNVVGRYSRGNRTSGFNVTGMLYTAKWDATDQIPVRAIESGALGRFDTIDPSTGGETSRVSGSFEWQRTRGRGVTRAAAYAVRYGLDLYSNFTYFLDDPVRGDQFKQRDRRSFYGGRVVHRRLDYWKGRLIQNTVGVQLRADDIRLGLTRTERRELVDVVREDDVVQISTAVHAQNEIAWAPWLRTLAGFRVDGYRFDVTARSHPENSGVETAGITSPKAGVVIGPFDGTEFYVNAGYGFHSNDARGATITVDPATGEPAPRVTPLARAKGAEVGVRTVAIPHVQSTLSLWTLGLDSELIFIGDAGTTEAGRPSRRYGLEFGNYYRPIPWLTLDADVAWSVGRFRDDDPAGREIPGAVRLVAAGGVTVDGRRPYFGALRFRYFGPRPLVEDGSVESRATALTNLRAGYRFSSRLALVADVLNLLDQRASDIDYYYVSRLPFEPADGVAGLHTHPAIPRTVRIGFSASF
ncbi:MAG: TonB-dependent receptor, partial [Vicinamibacterales bacterium]